MFRRGHSSTDPPLRNTEANLLYTGVTRGKRLVVLVGQKKAAAISGRRRWSKLDEWLRTAVTN